MEFLRSLVITMMGLVVAIGTQILVFMNGWGLEPKSWFWIIGVYFFGQIFAQVIIIVGAHKG